MVEVRPRFDVAVPPEIIVSVGEIGRITTGISGIIDAVIVDKERHITTGKVDVTVVGTNVMIPTDIQAIYYSPVIAISTGYVGAGETKVSDPIDVDTFRTKTIQGWAEFDGEIVIETAMLTNQFNPYPYYKTTISSGTTFTLSFTEVVSQVRIKLTNTSATTGRAFVAVGRAVV